MRRHTAFRPLFLVFCLAVTLAVPVQAARAEEEASAEDSAAARLFREGWWLETGAGALDQAKTKYEAAASSEGGTAIRARALYRLGLVLHRMGDGEAGIRVLERLGKEFAGERAVVAKAKQRLEEWVGADLRDSFDDWYARYQFSAVFQAKVAGLVLQLGSTDHKTLNRVTAELKAIGPASIPALRAHAGRSGQLGYRATGLLWTLGAVPPVGALVEHTRWIREAAQRDTVLQDAVLLADVRRTLAAQSGDDRDAAHTQWIIAALEGQSAVLAHFLGQAPGDTMVDPALLRWALDRDLSAEKIERVRQAALSVDAHAARRSAAAHALHVDRGQVDAKTVYAWLAGNNVRLRDVARTLLTQGLPGSEDAWKHLAGRLSGYDVVRSELRKDLQALLALMARMSPSDALPEADAALTHLSQWPAATNILQSILQGRDRVNPTARAWIERWLVRQEGLGARADITLYRAWGQTYSAGIATVEDLLRVATTTADVTYRWRAFGEAARTCDQELVPLLAAVKGRKTSGKASAQMWYGMRSNPKLAMLPWDMPTIRDLVGLLGLESSSSGVRQVFRTLMESSRARPLLLAHAKAAPDAFDATLAQYFREAVRGIPDGRALRTSAVRAAWPTWSAVQRSAGLKLWNCPSSLARELLRYRDAANDQAVRWSLWNAIEGRTLADLRLLHEFDSVEGLSHAVGLLSLIDRDAATYEAFSGVFDPAVAGHQFRGFVQQFWNPLTVGVLRDQMPAFLAACMKRGDAAAIDQVLRILKRQNSVKDLGIWHQLLRHEGAGIRAQVAASLGTLYSTETIAHLAALVDDENPTVRDAALASLERIKKTEEQKDYWRTYAKDKAKKRK